MIHRDDILRTICYINDMTVAPTEDDLKVAYDNDTLTENAIAVAQSFEMRIVAEGICPLCLSDTVAATIDAAEIEYNSVLAALVSTWYLLGVHMGRNIS